MRDDADAERVLERLQGDAARNAERGGETSGEVAAPGDVLMVAIADEGRVVGVSRTGLAPELRVVLRAHVGVLDDGRERGAAGVTVNDAGDEAGGVRLPSRRRGVGSAGGATGEEGREPLLVDRKPGGKSFDDAANGGGV